MAAIERRLPKSLDDWKQDDWKQDRLEAGQASIPHILVHPHRVRESGKPGLTPVFPQRSTS